MISEQVSSSWVGDQELGWHNNLRVILSCFNFQVI